MALTVAAVIENVCLSRHRRAEFVTLRICMQTPACFAHLVAQKPDQAPVYPVCPEPDRHWTWLQNSITTKPYVETGRMSKKKKAEFIGDIFVYEVSREFMVKFCQTPDLYRKVQSAQKCWLATGRVSDCRNSQIANRLELFNGPSESWESFVLKQYSRFLESWPIWDLKLKIRFAAVLSRNRIQQQRQLSKFHNF
jgi:hypothetical protein